MKGLLANPQGDTGPGAGLARAWVKFKYTATTGVVLLTSYNVASVTRNSTGDYTITFIRPFATPHFVVTGTASETGGGNAILLDISNQDPGVAGSKRIRVSAPGVGLQDVETHFIAWGEA